MEKDKRLELFKSELKLIATPRIREFAEFAISESDDYFFTMPASTSGKYHPLFSLGNGGLVRHTRAVVYFLTELWRSQLFDVDQKQFELLVVGAICHDIKKAGNDGSVHTVKEHPTLACDFLRNCNDIYDVEGLSNEELEYICSAVCSHMGIWGKNDGLPVPETQPQKLLHLADLLASRKDIDIKFISDGTETTERHAVDEAVNVPKDPDTFTMPFGKFRGKTFKEIEETGSDYLSWAVNNLTNSPDIVELMKEYLKNKK